MFVSAGHVRLTYTKIKIDCTNAKKKCQCSEFRLMGSIGKEKMPPNHEIMDVMWKCQRNENCDSFWLDALDGRITHYGFKDLDPG